SSLTVKLNNAAVTVATTKSGNVTTVTYNSPTGFSANVTNKVDVSFTDNATPAHSNSASLSFSEQAFATIPASAAVPASAVDKTASGFLFRGSQYDSTTYGLLSPSLVRAEEQLAGQLTDSSGAAYVDSYTPGTEANGAYVIPVVNLTLDTSTEQGIFTSTSTVVNADAAFPGFDSTLADNIAGEIIGYLDLKAGLYTFGVNATDGFRVTAGANPFDQFAATTLGIYDYRSLVRETVFNVKVDQDGIYPVRLVLWRVTTFGDDNNPSIEFYNVNSDGSKVLINDSTKANAIKSYAKRTGAVGTYASFVGPSSFVSPWANDVGYKNVTVVLKDGTTDKVDNTSVSLTIDGAKVTPIVTSAGGKTTVNYPATTTQIARMVHTATLIYKDVGGASHTNNWTFNSWRNHVLPAPLYFEDFESTEVGPDPLVPAGWVAFNDTASQNAGNDPADLRSDFYKGWVVTDTTLAPGKDFGVSPYTVQSLNGNVFTPGPDDGNPLLTNRFLYAESDARTGDPHGQWQDVTTKAFDLTGKTGVVLAFASSYEQNQDNSATIEYTVDDGATWLPLLYMLQDGYDGDSPDIFRDPFGNVDVLKTLNTPQANMFQYTPTTGPLAGTLVGGTYGYFVKAPITPALAPFIEGRINDDADNRSPKYGEGMRFEVLRVVGADNQKSVKFKFHADGTSSWFWAIDNVGIYSVPSLVTTPVNPTPSKISYAITGGKLVLTWTGGGTLESSTAVNGPYTAVTGGASSPATITMDGAAKFFRVRF
ncbi:MAG TPA: hypothetical protein VHH73_02725, partial [Verrucomicrobiae bacterium]|nr:hypothetical protein [Verrucomicrobiae bacterium]